METGSSRRCPDGVAGWSVGGREAVAGATLPVCRTCGFCTASNHYSTRPSGIMLSRPGGGGARSAPARDPGNPGGPNGFHIVESNVPLRRLTNDGGGIPRTKANPASRPWLWPSCRPQTRRNKLQHLSLSTSYLS